MLNSILYCAEHFPYVPLLCATFPWALPHECVLCTCVPLNCHWLYFFCSPVLSWIVCSNLNGMWCSTGHYHVTSHVFC
uniref:Uncharacterized protein n=1 Tax=Anguilla anguilla TaxID=7936 RepID=A0A0E9PWI8_ANGAN